MFLGEPNRTFLKIRALWERLTRAKEVDRMRAKGVWALAKMDGSEIYKAAVVLTDRWGRRFRDMLSEDSRASVIERRYFTDGYDWVPVMGWNEFCEAMVASGQGEWLKRITRLDEKVLLGTMESRLLDALEGRLLDSGQRVIDKDGLDACVKAIQGLVGRSKIITEQYNTGASNNEIRVRIIQSKGDADVPGGDCERLAREGSDGGGIGTDK